MVIYSVEGHDFRSLRALRDHLSLNYTHREALKYYSFDSYEYIDRIFLKNGSYRSVTFKHVYYCPKRKKFIIRADY